ncbi:MAG: sugar phosphate nucleotidyltransferase, partial [Pyrinomonadaceae bacterium]
NIAEAGIRQTLKTDADGRITEFSEKPKGDALENMRVDTSASFGLSGTEAAERPFLASMGIYVFKYDALEKLLNENPGWVDFGREIIPEAIKRHNVQAFLFKGYWEDIGTISAFYKANLDMTSPLPQFNFFDAESPIYTRARYLPGSKIQNCHVRDSFIADGCILNGAEIAGSIVGIRTRIANGARIEASFLMGADYYQTIDDMMTDMRSGIPPIGIGQDTIIRRAIVDKNARIGARVRLLNEQNIENLDGPDQGYYIRDHIIIVPKNSIVVDGTVV